MEGYSLIELTQLMSYRGSMYSLLSRFYREEVDSTFLETLGVLELELDSEMRGGIVVGYDMLKKYVKTAGENAKTDLAVDYASLFFGLGNILSGAFPYESVYTGSNHLLMQDSRDEVLAFYQEEGLIPEEDFNEPEDHIALELAFMAYLCQKTLEILEEGNKEMAEQYWEKQRSFLAKRLFPWVPAFCADIEKYASTDFYKAVAKITFGFIKLDSEFLAEVCWPKK